MRSSATRLALALFLFMGGTIAMPAPVCRRNAPCPGMAAARPCHRAASLAAPVDDCCRVRAERPQASGAARLEIPAPTARIAGLTALQVPSSPPAPAVPLPARANGPPLYTLFSVLLI